MPLTFSEHFLLMATASYTSLLDNELRNAMENDDNLTFGIVASIAK